MIASLVDGEADAIWTTLTLSSVRGSAVDFLMPLAVDKYSIFTPTFGIEEMAWTTYIQPLSHMLWISMFFVAVVMAAVIRWAEWRKTDAKENNLELFDVFKVLDFLAYLMTTVTTFVSGFINLT